MSAGPEALASGLILLREKWSRRRLGLVERGLENADELHLRRCDTTGATILVGRPHAVSGTVCSWERL
jgi:hypothetical protein